VLATSDPSTGLLTVPAGGGDLRVLTKPDDAGEDHYFPHVLPDGSAVLYTIFERADLRTGRTAIVDLKTGQSRVLLRGSIAATYAESGHLLYADAGTIRAVRFDLSRREVLGDPVPVVERVLTGGTTGAAGYAVSRSGTLVYLPGGIGGQATRSLVWVNRRGEEEPIKAPIRAYTLMRLSPDGTRIALDIRDQQNDIWIWDLTRQTLTPLTFDPAVDRYPVWTPDSRRIIFASTRDGGLNLYWQAADGTGSVERLADAGPAFQIPNSVSPDGSSLLSNQSGDIGVLPLAKTKSRNDRGPRPVVRLLMKTPVTEDNAEISSDGRWLAYQSAESGQPQIYVRPYPNVEDGRWQVSTDGGVKPLWSRNGRELFYVAPNSAFMTTPVMPSTTTFLAGKPTKLFDASYYYFAAPNRTYDVSADGQRFLMIKDAALGGGSGSTPGSLVVVLNWFQDLKEKVK
jgi:serine/threonine-protein kinase